jgi:hypothetical protein
MNLKLNTNMKNAVSYLKLRYSAVLLLLLPTILICADAKGQGASDQVFKAGAATSVITPNIGSTMNGNMKAIVIKQIHDDTYARALVLDDGKTRLAIVVTDLCMISREVCDEAKQGAQRITGIPVENIMISATHTHSSGTACSVFGSEPEKEYLDFLTVRIRDAVVRANNNLAPARIGWSVGSEPTQVHNRRWKLKTGVTSLNPFGQSETVKMNPGRNPDITEPAGPVDPGLPVISIQTPDGRPIALFANYSLHYVGGTGAGELSADYYGYFAERMKYLLNAENEKPAFVAMMSNGTSGDINNVVVKGSKGPEYGTYGKIQQVANVVAAEAYKAYQNIQYQNWISLSSVQRELILGVRLPEKSDIDRAKGILVRLNGSERNTQEEFYAHETIMLSKYPKTVPVILQAFRIGDLAITAAPCEVFVEIGLGIKEKSPFKPSFMVSLANGYNGYLPTPEHHKLGGYETWRARSSYLEVNASTKITQNIFEMLAKLKSEQVK